MAVVVVVYLFCHADLAFTNSTFLTTSKIAMLLHILMSYVAGVSFKMCPKVPLRAELYLNFLL